MLAATDLDAAVALLRPLAERGQILEPVFGSDAVTFAFADLLSKHGRVDDAYEWLMERAGAGSWTAVRDLADPSHGNPSIVTIEGRQDAGVPSRPQVTAVLMRAA